MKSRCLWICSTALLLVSTGCFGVDDQSCEYWVEQFEGQYGNKEAAIKNIGRLKCADASEPLKKHFPNSLYRRDILAAAKAIGMNTHTVALVESALRDRDIGAVAIRIALEWNVSDIKSQLSSMIRSQETAQIRQQALEAMMELTSPPKVVIGKGPKDPGAVLYTGRPARNEINVYVQHVQDPTTGVLVRGGTVLIKGDYKAGVTAKAVADLINAHEEATKLILAEAGGDGSGKVAANKEPVPLERDIRDRETIDTLVWVVGEEPTLQGIETNIYAASMLDTVDWRSLKDDKLTEQATQNLIKALFMQDAAAGKDASVAARFAIRNIGSGATKALLAAYVGKNEELNQFAERNGLARWRYMFGHQLVELLWDVGDRKAAPTIMELMGRSINPPPADVARLPPEKRGEWTAANLNRLAASALTVGSLVNDNSIEYARKILTQTNPPIDAAVFKQVQLAIGLMGTAASRKLAWELYRAEDEKVAAAQKEIDDLDAQVKKLEEKGKEKDEEALKKLRTQGRAKLSVRNGLLMRKANMLQPLYLGLGADGVEAYQKEAVESPQDIIKEDAAEPMALGYYEAVSQCKQDAGCYIKMLQAWKGKLAEIPKNIKAARKTLLDERKKVRDEANKFKDAAKLKEEEYKKLVKEVNDMTEALNKKKKITKKEADDHKALVEKAQTVFNEVKQAWEDRNKVIGKVEPFKKGVKDAEKQVHMLEKAVLMLGEYKDRHSEAVKLACDLFAETKPLFKPNMPAYFEQFRQWTIVFLEHAGTKDDLPIIEALLAGEQGDGKRKELTAWTLRLESLIARIGRR